MSFPNWERRLDARLGRRTRARSEVPVDVGVDIVAEVLREVGINLRSTRRVIYDPFIPGNSYSFPRNREQLADLLTYFENTFNSLREARQQEETPQDTTDYGDQMDYGGPVQATLIADEGDALLGNEVCIRVYYMDRGMRDRDVRDQFEEITVNVSDEDYAILTTNLGDRSRAAMLQRIQAYYRAAQNRAFLGYDEEYDEAESRFYVDAEIIQDGPCRAMTRSRASAPAAASVPTALTPFHERRGFRRPMNRLSNGEEVLVDHPGLQYMLPGHDFCNMDKYEDPWLKHNSQEDICWMTGIINLVNVHMKRTYLTYQKLWKAMGKQGAFDPVEAKRGLSINDMIPVFDYYDRAVKVIDGSKRLVYERKRETRKYKNVIPHAWTFYMTEHHIYVLDKKHLQKTNSGLRIDQRRGEYDEVLIDHPFERVSPFYPPHEKKHFATVLGEQENPPRTIFLASSNANFSEHPDYFTLQDILFDKAFNKMNLQVIVQAHLINTVLLELFRTYNYRPTVIGNRRSGIQSIVIHSISNRGKVTFRNPLGFGGDRRGHLPDESMVEEESYFSSISDYDRYCAVDALLQSWMHHPSLLSVMNESTANVCHKFVRGGLFSWTIPSEQVKHAVKEPWCSLDVNRIYPSTFMTDEFPTCSVFDNFEKVPQLQDAGKFFKSLNSLDLCLVFVMQSPTVYLDRGASLCFKNNLCVFLSNPKVHLVPPSFQAPLFENSYNDDDNTYIKIMAVLRTTPKKNTDIWRSICDTWKQTDISRALRKRILVRQIGRLGKAFNTDRTDTHVFANGEEAVVFAEDRNGQVSSIQDELYLAFVKGECVPRLESHFLMHLYVLDTYRISLMHWYNRLTYRGVDIKYIRCDEFFFPQAQLMLVEDLLYSGDPDGIDAFGELKINHQDLNPLDLGFLRHGQFCFELRILPTDVDHEIYSVDTVCPSEIGMKTNFIEPVPDEKNITNLGDFSRLLLTAEVPGAGKSYSVLSRYQENCVVVCPTNALCVEFRQKYPGCTAVTLHKFLREVPQDDEAPTFEVASKKQIEDDMVLLLDEIYMYDFRLLGKLYFRLLTTKALKVFATGDPNQLPPIGEPTSKQLHIRTPGKEKRMKAVEHLFPNQMSLLHCKRGDPTTNEQMKSIAVFMKLPGATTKVILNLIKRSCTSISYQEAIDMMKEDLYKYVAVCYYNLTCHHVASAVLPHGTKLQVGTKLVNRKMRIFDFESDNSVTKKPLMVNYEYLIKELNADGTAQLVDVNALYDGIFVVDHSHVEKHMHWAQTRTCHSLQGSSVSSPLLLFDLESKRISPEFIYVALTRARDIKTIYIVEGCRASAALDQLDYHPLY